MGEGYDREQIKKVGLGKRQCFGRIGLVHLRG